MKILITGASSGLGEGLARVFCRPEVSLGLVARRREELERLREELSPSAKRVLVFPADVTDTKAMGEVVRGFADEAGGLDLVIANAGVGEGTDHERFDAERVAEVTRVNIIGLTNTLLPAIPILRAQGSGTLVGIASVAGFRALPGSLIYSATKGAVITLMEGLHMELEHLGIHAMAICPGFVRTPLTDKNDFAMPFRLECDDACRRMKNAILKKKVRYVFPAPMALAAQLLRIAPRALLKRVSPKSAHRAGR